MPTALTAEQIATKVANLNVLYDKLSLQRVQSMTIGQTQAVMQKLKEVRAEIDYWENKSAAVENNYQNSALINFRGAGRS